MIVQMRRLVSISNAQTHAGFHPSLVEPMPSAESLIIVMSASAPQDTRVKPAGNVFRWSVSKMETVIGIRPASTPTARTHAWSVEPVERTPGAQWNSIDHFVHVQEASSGTQQ
jgi:hypothetical protein